MCVYVLCNVLVHETHIQKVMVDEKRKYFPTES